MKSISIVIPAKDEEKRLPSFLKTVIEFCHRSTHSYEIIIVDDGSKDATAPLALAFQKDFSSLRVISLDRNHGKGFAVKQGFLASHGDIVLFLDADGSTSPTEIERHLYLLDQENDVVIGSRVLRDVQSQVKTRFYRKIMGNVFNYCVSSLLIKGIKDTQCGFKMFKSAAAKNIFQRVYLEGFGFDLEVLFLAQKFHYRIKEVPVNWSHVQGSKVNIWKDSLRMFFNILEIKKLHKDL